jgi:hypothetical protein
MIQLPADLRSREIPVWDLELAIQDALAALAEIDCSYNLEYEGLPSRPEPARLRLAEAIEQRRRQDREPYVKHLAHLYQLTVSARMFGDPAAHL